MKKVLWTAVLSLALAAAWTATAAGWDPDLFAGLKARSIGPAGMSGRVPALDAVASDPRTVYVGSASGGVWKSMDAGLTFKPIFDDQPVHSIGALAIFQADPAIVWVGTGEGNPRNTASVGNGIYKTMDGGETWQHLGLDATERIARLALHPANQDVAYVCALGREWGENPERGVFKTTDGGKTWAKILYVDEKTGCADLAMDPANPNKLYAAMWQFRRWPYFFKSGGPGSGLYSSQDGGATWKRYEEEDGLPKGELGRIGIAISRSNPEIVYAVVEAEASALLRSSDGGKSFETVNSKPDVAPRPFYFADLRVDPAWPNRVYNLGYSVQVSDDSGKTFKTLPGTEATHGDNHSMWINPGNPNHIFVTDDGGVHESRDRGNTFRFVGTLPLAQFYHVGFDFDTPYNVYGGLQDNGSWRGPSSIHQRGGIRGYFWKDVGFGDGFDVQPDPTDSRMGYSMAQGGNLVRWNLTTGERKRIAPAPEGDTKLRFNWNAGLAIDPFDPATIYYGSQFVHRSKNRGESWEVLSPDLTTNNPEWQKQNESGGLTPDVSTAENYTTIMTIAPSAVERGVIWVGTDDGRVQVTRDGGKTWASVEKNLKGVPANTWVPHIEASKFQGGEAFVVLDNHRRSDWASYVYRTTDYGATWKSLATPDVKGYCLVLEQDPVKPELLFLGTEFGLFLSFDGGAKWYPFRQGLGTASVMDLAVHPRDNDLIIATHGRAMYIVDDIRPLREMSDASVGQKLQLFSVAPASQFHFSSEDGGFGGGMADYRGENRDYGALVSYWLGDDDLPLPDGKKEAERQKALRAKKAAEAAAPPAPEKATGPKAAGAKPAAAPAAEGDKGEEKGKGEGKPEVTLEISDAGGKLVRTLKVPATRGLNRTVWALDRDAFKQPPREEGRRRRRGNDGGPELAPGTYQLVAKFRGEEAKTTITVLPDSTSKAVAADWQAHEQAVQRLGATNDRLVDAIQRIRTTRADIDLVSQKLREKLTDAGEKDDKKIDEHPLIKAAGPLQEGLTKLEKKLWQPPEAKGLLPGDDAFSKLGEAFFGIDASWGAPTANDLTLLAAAEKLANSALEEVNAYFAKDVADYKAKVAAEGVGLLTK